MTRPIVVALAFVFGGVGNAAEPPALLPPRDPREVVVLREDCRGALSRREITLFANGTLRLREGVGETTELLLHELDRARTARFLERLQAMELDELASPPGAPSGEWTETCRLELDRPGYDPLRVDYERYATGSLALDGLRRLIEDLGDELAGARASAEIPATYRPAVGDRLERADGELFEVVAFTLDGKGVELVGVDQPVTLFVERERIREQFARLAPRFAPTPPG
jgi:hypothetical protein